MDSSIERPAGETHAPAGHDIAAERRRRIERLGELIFHLRQKCALKDMHLVREHGISTAEYNCLIQFFDRSTAGMKELGERLEITPGGVTRIVSSLERKGILERRISPEDRRGIDVVLTSEGARIVGDIHRATQELHAEILAGISDDRQQDMIGAIELLSRAIGRWLESRADDGR
ncbi:MAG: MarR family transcriptional regulator [Candidatus Krumholzibacteriota bacterium]|nr:MarR family transcriptional regulator [Candidatus Krumholzibacteriota bacterium]